MIYQTPGILIYTIAVTALIGLCMGSFLNCLVWRRTNGESVLAGRSHCTTCNHVLGPLDLIPVVSWVALRGRCRHCGAHVSVRYLLVEVLTAVIYVSIVLGFDLTVEAVAMLFLASILICITLTDLDDSTIPDGFIVAGVVGALVFAAAPAIIDDSSMLALLLAWGGALACGLSVSLPLFVLSLIMDRVLKRDSLGGGDIKLFFMIGMYFSWQVNLFTLIVSCVLGIAFSVIWFKGRLETGRQFPFGPAIAAATWVSMLVGPAWIGWYTGLF